MIKVKQKRKRGVLLTPKGLEKIQKARFSSEHEHNFGKRYTYEKISELTNLDINTIKKILDGQEGVDKRSLESFFLAFNLELDKDDYTKLNLNKRQDWREAVCVSNFYGRNFELDILEKWLLKDRCRLITLLGMGGIGKTTLSIKFAEQIEKKFDCVIWKSLRDVPPLKELLANLIEFLSEGQETEVNLPERVGARITRLIDYLRSLSCLIVLDNAESLLDSGSQAGKYRQGYEEYGELLRRVGETNHISCLILTTREKPKEVAILEGEGLSVRSLQIEGLKAGESREIFKIKGLSGSESELNALCDRYAGNPLALKVVATTIQDLFEGNIAEFLHQEKAVFGNIRNVLDQQFERLSHIEKEIMYWLAINREPISLSELQEDLVLQVLSLELVEALESLSRRSLIEKNSSRFTQQPVVMEYVTSRLIEAVCDEIVTGKLLLFRDHALIKATAKDYVRETQICLLLQPVIDQLWAVFRGKKNIEERLSQILAMQQETSPLERGYTAGNIINLFCRLAKDLTGYDFSNLCVWQADLRQARLHTVSFQNADLSKSIFAETFGGIMSVAFSPDGKLLAVGDTNSMIRLYRVADSQQLLTFRGHTNWVVSLVFSPDGRTIVSGSSDCTVRLWDVSTGKCLHILQEHAHEVWSVSFSPDGNIIASGSDDCTARLWQVSTGKCKRVLQEHTNYVLSVDFSPDGQMLASGSHDQTVRLWDVNTGECKRIFRGHHDEIRSVVFSPDGQMLASGSVDQTVKLWDVNTGECLKTFQGHSQGVLSVTFSPQGDLLASGSVDQTVKLWDVNTGECLKTFQGHSNWVLSVDFSPQGNLLASGSHDQTMKLWDVGTGKSVKTFQGRTNQILSVAFSPDAQMLVSSGSDQKIRVWNTGNGQELKTLHEHTSWVYSVAFNPKGNTLVSGSADKTVKLWDVSTERVLKTFRGHHAAVRSVVFDSDNRTLASSSEDQTIRLWDISTGQTLRIFRGHQALVWSIAFSPDGQILASGSSDGTIKLWDVSTGECLRTLKGHTSWVWSVAFSPDNKSLASTGPDQTLRLWNLSTDECSSIVLEDMGGSLSVAFSSDNQKIASSSRERKIKFWNVKTGECFQTSQGHEALIWSVAFSPDNQTLVSGSEDETIKFWNVKTGECFQTLKVKKLYEGMKIAGATDLTEAQIATLKALGAFC